MKKEDIKFSRKEFLNLPGHESTAAIVTHIKTPYKHGYTEVVLDISDCSRVISMSMDLEDELSRENAIFKVDTLIDVLNDFKVALVKECKVAAKKEEKDKKKKKK